MNKIKSNNNLETCKNIFMYKISDIIKNIHI